MRKNIYGKFHLNYEILLCEIFFVPSFIYGYVYTIERDICIIYINYLVNLLLIFKKT